MDHSSCTLRVTATESGEARASVRRHQFAVGRPIEFDEASPRIAALEYVLGALGGELVGGLRTFAARRRVTIDDVEATVSADLEHPLAYLEVVGESGPPRIARIHVKVYVSAPDADAVRRIWNDMLDRLPLICTFRTALPIELELAIT
jgi:uncharacterized OsmC-like protein